MASSSARTRFLSKIRFRIFGEDGFAAGERYFPDGMGEPQFYRPVPRGLELKIGEKLASLREKNQQRK